MLLIRLHVNLIKNETIVTQVVITTLNEKNSDFNEFIYSRTTTAGTSYGTTTEDYDEYEPLFSLGVRSPRQIYTSSSFRKHDWEVQDINCQGVPFTTIPGKLDISFVIFFLIQKSI